MYMKFHDYNIDLHILALWFPNRERQYIYCQSYNIYKECMLKL